MSHSSSDREAEDIAAAAFILKVIIFFNIVLAIAAMLAERTAIKGPAHEIAIWVATIEAILFAVVFLPVFIFRKLVRQEPLKVAAARAALWFRDALALV